MRFARPTPETGKFLKRSDGHFERKLVTVTIENTSYRTARRGTLFTPRIDGGENWRKNCASSLKKEFLVIVVLVERYFPLDRFNFQRELV